ncbi:MAG: response regulator [Desulfuromonadaceae bacterium]|nr:response regulator [Desulfuromonadaceae bacterium]MDD5107614.1 response regulator [Desulfuromonadaceae bacterium]
MPERGEISILLVEHCSENLSWIEEHVSGLDIELFWASSGAEALELARENDFAMALLGVNNPESGLETAKMILSNQETQHIPLIFVSNGPEDISLSLKTIGPGIVDYLTRPIEPLMLHNKLQLFRELFHQRKAARRHITALSETHEQLRKGKERYKRLLESVTSYVYSVRVHEGLPVSTVHSQGSEAMTGFSPEEYAADPGLWYRMIPEEDRPLVLDVAKRILNTASPLTIEHRIHHKDGHIHWVRNTLVPQFNLEGELFSYDGIISDITERNQAERKLAKSVSLLEATLESTADGILVVDMEGTVISYNKKYLSLWGISEDIVASRNDRIAHKLRQLKEPEPLAEKLHYMYAHPEAKNSEQVELTDGRLFEIYSKPQIMGDEIVGRVWSFRDITDKKNLEEQLRHAQKMEAIGQMAGGIAHDFNNILTVILGYGSRLQELCSDDELQRENIDQVLKAAERAANLTRSLLVFSSRQVMTAQTVDLNDIVRNMEKFLRRIIGEDIELRTGFPQERLTVYADSGQLEQVVMNLAVNARDAMPRGGILEIETQFVEPDKGFFQAFGEGEPGSYAMLMVSDNGCGMDNVTREKLFEPFFSTKGVGKGTGLGLSVVYGIVRQHKGFIKVFSKPGMGTTFKILIPLYKGELHAAAKNFSPVPAGGAETILVAEDDPDIRQLAATCLQEFGYNVIVAKDGVEVVRKFRARKNEIDLVAIDLLMPKKSGQEVYREIKKMRPNTKIVFMSGYSPDLLQSRGLCKNGNEILMKPFRPFDLARKVREVLDK